MKSLRVKCKAAIFNGVAFLLFHMGALKLFNRFVNCFQYKRHEDGKLRFPFVTRRRCKNVQVLVYHRVNDDKDPFLPATPIAVFAREMEYLVSNFDVYSLEEAVERMVRKDVPDNAVVVTFDDGYSDNYGNAFPILKRLSIPATIFLATDAIGSGRVLWHDRVFSAFRQTQVPCLESFSKGSETYPMTTIKEKQFAQMEVLKFLWSRSNRERPFWIDRLVEKLRVVDRREAPGLMLTWDQVKVMHRNGLSFGSHTMTHPILSRVSTTKATVEIQESKRIIEENLGIVVKTFAYPNGKKQDFNEAIKRLVRDAGYICAVTTIFGANEETQDLFEMRRATPWNPYVPAFATKLNWYKFSSPRDVSGLEMVA